jgi:curved DNA-binding protein
MRRGAREPSPSWIAARYRDPPTRVMVEFQDYYKTLGIERSASQEEVRRSYRKLARTYHPDVNKEAGAEARFKQITEAYEVLKDPEKRKRYDALGSNWRAGQDFTPPPGFEGFEFDLGGARAGGEGFGDFSSFFETLFGGGGFGGPFAGGARRGGPRGRRPRAVAQEAELVIPLEEAVRGATREVALEAQEVGADGRVGLARKTLSLKIPPGTRPGTVMRLAGQGARSSHGGPAGDLLLHIRIAPHPRFTIEGDDLSTRLPVTPWEAALGTKVELQLVEGSAELSVPPGSKSGKKLRLRGQGLPKKGGGRGDLYVELAIHVPATLTPRERELFTELARESSFDPRRDA